METSYHSQICQGNEISSSAVVRNSKTVSFLPYIKMAADRLSGLEPAKLEYFDSGEKQAGLSVDTIREVEHALFAISEVAKSNSQMLIHLNQLLDEPSGHGRPRRFIAWIQHVVSRASSRAVYDPLNALGAAQRLLVSAKFGRRYQHRRLHVSDENAFSKTIGKPLFSFPNLFRERPGPPAACGCGEELET